MAQFVPNGSAVFIGRGGSLAVGHTASDSRVAASTIKLPLLIEIMRRDMANEIDLTEHYTVRQQDIVGGTGILQNQLGRTYTLSELVRFMIVNSDNVASNVLLGRIGNGSAEAGMDAVNNTMASLGFLNSRWERRLLDTAAQQRGLENVTTAEDLAQMLRRIWAKQLLSDQASERMLSLLRERGDIDKDWLGRGLPPGTSFLHINGTLAGVRNDAGIVELPGGQAYVLVVCQDGLANEPAGEAAIANLARRVHEIVTGEAVSVR
jgi:beta-lactamase class A